MKVLIVGAGPAGLVMANELARYGVQCRLIDKQRERSKPSRAIALLPRTGLAALHYGTQPAAYLNRPDGYVAFRCALADAARLLPGYLQKIVFADSRLQREVA